MRKYLIETFGCQMNYHDSERMAGLLESAGYDRTESDSDADLVVINTCSVRERAEEKLYTRLGEIKEMGRELGRDPIVAVTGCVAQQEGERLLRRLPDVDLILGPDRIQELPEALSELEMRAYEVTQREGDLKISTDLPTQKIWGYNGLCPGPTYIAKYGKPILVRWDVR